ncbi:dihydrodipicolinate synthase family protein [Mesorhizobium sp. CAU 1741]|uniref:dihydrodipicolinate synthase family protein n=1 Tax=Mesorhizobium sp. CAU 1741 TaxID=3140366 RepID=UPI00325B0771
MSDRFKAALTGISGILVTPYDGDGEIAPARLAPVIDKVIEAGVHMPVVNGNTGEFYALTIDEAVAMVHAVVELVGERAPVLGGVGRGVRDACRLAAESKKAGAAGLMVHQPPDPFVSPRGTVDYVKRVAEAGDGTPLVLYMRNDAIGLDTIAELCSIDGVKGVKWATPNALRLSEAIEASPDDIVWVGGLAEVWAPAFYAAGARGFTSGLINVWPEHSVAIHTALEAGDYATARRLISAMKEFEIIRAEELNGTNVTGVKSALIALGIDCGPTRPPSAWPLTARQAGQLDAFLKRNGLIG